MEKLAEVALSVISCVCEEWKGNGVSFFKTAKPCSDPKGSEDECVSL